MHDDTLELLEKMEQRNVPEHLRSSLARWYEEALPPGSFLMAALSNQLTETFKRADNKSLPGIYNLVTHLYNDFPMQAWGSQENVDTWRGMHPRGES